MDYRKFFSEKTSAILAIISFVLMVLTPFVFIIWGSWNYSDSLDESIVGQFGDFIGGVVGTLIAFVAAILYYVALKEQRKDITLNAEAIKLQTNSLKIQSEEFKAQKEELEKARHVYEQQTKTMKVQQFESSFFSLFNVYMRIKDSLNQNYHSKDFFYEIYKELSILIDCDLHSKKPWECRQTISDSYSKLFLLHQGHLSHYFRLVYQVMKMIDNTSFLETEEKIGYAKIFRSQLTDYELMIMYYNCQSHYAGNARNLIYKYNILKHVEPVAKYELCKKYNLSVQDNEQLAFFFRFFSSILEKAINCIIDSIEIEDIEEHYEEYNCNVKINNDEDILISILFIDSALIPSNFELIIYDFLYDKLFAAQFKPMVHPFGKHENCKFQSYVMFKYTIEAETIVRLNTDMI